MERAASCRVIIFGTGGVGSWCAESLVRSGISHLTLVDYDTVAASNINRQLMATTKTIGLAKVEVLRDRLLSINPSAEIEARREFFNEQTAASFGLEGYDYIIDCIDSLKDKILLMETACRTSACFLSSMGAALKIDPSRVKVSEFWEVNFDPLARMLRKRIRQEGRQVNRPFLCVWSDEVRENKGEAAPDDGAAKKHINGTAAPVTAIFGHTLAALVLRDIADGPLIKQ